ncbi:MAG: hypothetical protein COC23_02685 [Hyphomicrobiales bacterium]|nr:MAG: hypothetical protein COC23_02685 [Hyphomicrobiales bacterium]
MSEELRHIEVEQAVPERERRHRVLKRGTASYANQSISIDVVIRDFSSTGARLKVSDAALLPDKFTLHIPMDGVEMDCSVRWRSGDLMGVLFVSEQRRTHGSIRQKVEARGLTDHRQSSLRKPGY